MSLNVDRNLGTAERLSSLVLGGTSIAAFLNSSDKGRKWPLAAFGAVMLLRGATAFCPVKQAATGRCADREVGAGRPTAKRAGSPDESWTERKDLVQEATEESFPASDSPSFNPGAIH